MTEQLSIFQDVVSIMKNDSATCKDMTGPEPDQWLEALKAPVSSEEFVYLVNEYLAFFGLDGHLRFSDTRQKRKYLKVHEYDHHLFISDDRYAPVLNSGDEIVRIDGKPLWESQRQYAPFFACATEARRNIVWSSLLQYTDCLDIVPKDGMVKRFYWKDAPAAKKRSPYAFRQIADHLFYVRLDDFSEPAEIQRRIEEHTADFERNSGLIVDVRGNTGGSDIAFLPLLTYAFPAGKDLDDCISETYPVEINYSLRNCDQRIADLQQYLRQGELEESSRTIVQNMLEELKVNRGKGFIPVPDSPIGLCGRNGPEKICVLTDEYCASSGDSFAELMSQSQKTVLIGRPTMGITDYSNCAVIRWGDCQLQYPTSRDTRIDVGKGLSHKGVPVDIQVFWTPQEFDNDIEMETAMRILQA